MEFHTSETITDTSNTSTNNELSLSFTVDNGGTETVYVEDKLLTNYEVAKARAESVLLEEGAVTKKVTFNTYHIDNLHIGDIIQIDDLLFKVTNLRDIISGAKVEMEVTAIRYLKDTYRYDEVLVISATLTAPLIFSFCELDGYVYAGTESYGKIYRSALGSDYWDEVFNHSSESMVYKMCTHNNYIYAGTGEGSGEIYRSNDGTTWSLVYSSGGGTIRSLCSHSDGYIYAAKDGNIYRSNDGTTWAVCGTSIGTLITDLYSHTDGYIYAASSGVLYRSNDGTTWSLVYTFAEPLLTSFVHNDGYFYTGTYPAKIYRSQDLSTWDEVFSSETDDYIMCLLSHSSGTIYAGAGDYDSPIYKSEDGTTWSVIAGVSEMLIFDLFQSSDGRLYAGTGSNGRIYADTLVSVGKER